MKVHQNIILNGIDIGESTSRKDSNFCNEGKWNNYIDPLLPDDCKDKTFIELGCNAGLFLRLAKEKGFRNVIGYDKSQRTCRVAQKYRDSLGLDYKIINNSITEKFDFDNLALADVVLMANFHYHMYAGDFIYLMDRLMSKACYCIVVSAEVKKVHWRARADIDGIRNYFKDWQEIEHIEPLPHKDDVHPRVMYSVLFESNHLRRIPIDDIHTSSGKTLNLSERDDFVKMIINGKRIEASKTKYFDLLKRIHRDKKTEEQLIDFINDKVQMLSDVRDNGLKRPILIDPNNNLIEGGHRLILLRNMGYDSVITRTI